MQLNSLNEKYKYLIGIDEVGYGCAAGPIHVCAFKAEIDFDFPDLKDSKTFLTEKAKQKRTQIADELKQLALDGKINFKIETIHPNNIEEYSAYGKNMHAALKYLYWKSASFLIENKEETLIVLDGNIKFPKIPHELCDSVSMPKADVHCKHVSAASIIAKVERDMHMNQLFEKYPQYFWNENKGYLTKKHIQALEKFGFCEEHRYCFEPIKSMKEHV